MIKYLPIPYKNELFFSILSRCYSNSPYTSSIKFTSTIFNRANEYIDYLFYNCLNEDTKKLIDNLLDLEDIIVNHTMIGYYSMFLDMDKYSIVKNKALKLEPGIYKKLSIPIRNENQFIRYCPLCIKEHNEIYFDILPQIKELSFCPIHKCRFLNTSINVSKSRDTVYKSFDELILNYNIEIVEENINVLISRYIQSILDVKSIDVNKCAIGRYLSEKLEDTIYMSKRGGQKKLDILINDLDEFYKDLENYNLTKQRLALILRDKYINVFDVILIAYFLKLEPNDLLNRRISNIRKVDRFDNRIIDLKEKGYSNNQISVMLNVSHELVRKVVLKKYKGN